MSYYDTWEARAELERQQKMVNAHNHGFRNGKASNARGLEAVKAALTDANKRNKVLKVENEQLLAKLIEYRLLLDHVDFLMEGSNTEFAVKLRASLQPYGETKWQSIKRFIFLAVARFFT